MENLRNVIIIIVIRILVELSQFRGVMVQCSQYLQNVITRIERRALSRYQLINQQQSEYALEVGGIVRGQRQFMGQRDAGDLQVELGKGGTGSSELVFLTHP